MAYIYIAFVDTPGLFASMIRRHLKQKYIHVAISLDAELEETYSVGRRNPHIPIIAGFEREKKWSILSAFPTAEYMVCRMKVTEAQKEQIRARLHSDYQKRFHYHYAVIGLLPLVLGKPFYQKGHFTCSSYIAKVLEEAGIVIANKHFSLVTPKDFYHYPEKTCIYKGTLAELVTRSGVKKYGIIGGSL